MFFVKCQSITEKFIVILLLTLSTIVLSLTVATQSSAADLPPAQEPANLLGIWTYTIIGRSATSFAVFNNGDFTYDIDGVFNLGVVKSRQQKPEEWGVWRTREDTDGSDILDLKLSTESEFEDYLFWFKNVSGTSNQTLNHCYTNLQFNDGGPGSDGDIFVGASKTWCFLKEGYFASTESAFGIAPGIVIGGPGAALQGSYRIDGHAMTLRFANNTEKTVSFSYTLPERKSIRINTARYSQGRSTLGIKIKNPTDNAKNKSIVTPIMSLLFNEDEIETPFIGTQNLTITENGTFISNSTDRFVMRIDEDKVNITDEANPANTASGVLNDNRFIANGANSSLSCQTTYSYTGSISNQTVSGNVTGNVICQNNRRFQVAGSFSAQR